MSTAPNSVQAYFANACHGGDKFFTSVLVELELWYGVFKSARVAENTRRCESFFSGPIEVLYLQSADARIAGELRAKLEATKKPIGAYDLLVASQALHHKMTLITANASEFSRVKGLLWEDWSQ